MSNFLDTFKDENGNWSSKRVAGFVGLMIVHICYAIRCIIFNDASDTIALVTADTALLGVETVTRAMTNRNNDNTDNERDTD